MDKARPEYIDIHSHVNFPGFDLDREEVVERALQAGVWMINVGTGKEMSQKAVNMTAEFPYGVYAIVGLHPIYAHEEIFDANDYRMMIKNYVDKNTSSGSRSKIVGIGECGLDYFHSDDPEHYEIQKSVFIKQIELALELDLPLMLHIRSGNGKDAYRNVIDILKEYKIKHGEKLRGDAHFFAGSVKDAEDFLELGFTLSYTGVITFAKQYAELIKSTPSDKIMSETDCPYVSPEPFRGKRNEPMYVREVANTIASIKGENPVEFRKILVENAFRLWKL